MGTEDPGAIEGPTGRLSSERCEGPVAVGLGSNLGDRAENLRYAIREIERVLTSVRVSEVYETAPEGATGGGPFLNMCVAGYASDEAAQSDGPRSLLRQLLFIEIGAGRAANHPQSCPRTLDLDLLLVSDCLREGPDLELPHPRLHTRSFVLAPLSDVLPDWRHPRIGKSVREMAGEVGRPDTVRRIRNCGEDVW